MKLFITNKSYFEEEFDNDLDFQLNSVREPLTTKIMHQRVFNELFSSVNIKGKIPLIITTNYDNGEGIAIFEFITKKDDIYYYEYTGTAS